MKKAIISTLILTLASSTLWAQVDSLERQIDRLMSESKISEDLNLTSLIDPTPPNFPGGNDSLKIFVANNNRWPVIQGKSIIKVFVSFIVNEDGSISEVNILKGDDQKYNEEAKRIVSIMPKWQAERVMDTPLKRRILLAISFSEE